MDKLIIITAQPTSNLQLLMDERFKQSYSNYDGTIAFIVDTTSGQIINWPGRPEHYLDELG